MTDYTQRYSIKYLIDALTVGVISDWDYEFMVGIRGVAGLSIRQRKHYDRIIKKMNIGRSLIKNESEKKGMGV